MTTFFTIQRIYPYVVPFLSLSYPVTPPKNPDSFPDSSYYGTGLKDLYFVVGCIAVMAVLRDGFRLWIFEPFAHWKLSRDLSKRKGLNGSNATSKGSVDDQTLVSTIGRVGGVSNGNGHVPTPVMQPTPKELRKLRRSVLRFAEQGWSFVYYTVQWCCGLYVHCNLPTRLLEPVALWQGYPHIPLAAPVKFYYLTQTAFYFHQILILNAEERRKDHVQMMTHHIITIILIASSYFMSFTRVGCLIMVLMDWCDIFLPLAKMIRYIEISQLACDMTFAWFLVSWFITRHILFLVAIVSTFKDVPRLIPFKWSVEEGHYLTRMAWLMFVTLLFTLQILQIVWFGMICRVAWRVLTTDTGASDVRSDDDSEGKEQ